MELKTILIADDETHILNVVSIKLENAGYNVITAEDGAVAYDLARAHHPDLIIADFQMPHLSGVELCSKLRADEATQHIPAMLLTARGFAISETDMSAGNIRQVIAKPFSPREVLSCVNDLLSPVTADLDATPCRTDHARSTREASTSG